MTESRQLHEMFVDAFKQMSATHKHAHGSRSDSSASPLPSDRRHGRAESKEPREKEAHRWTRSR